MPDTVDPRISLLALGTPCEGRLEPRCVPNFGKTLLSKGEVGSSPALLLTPTVLKFA